MQTPRLLPLRAISRVGGAVAQAELCFSIPSAYPFCWQPPQRVGDLSALSSGLAIRKKSRRHTRVTKLSGACQIFPFSWSGAGEQIGEGRKKKRRKW